MVEITKRWGRTGLRASGLWPGPMDAGPVTSGAASFAIGERALDLEISS